VHRLVEVGVVRFRLDGHETATFQQLIDPHIPIPPDVQQVHGITNALVRGQPTVEQVIPHFIEFLGEPNTILLALNAPFDLGLLAMALIRLGIAYPPHDVFDTLEMTRRLYPTWPSHSLENVAIGLNVANRAEHRPLSDARVWPINPPSGFEALAMAMAKPCAITIVYEPGWQRPTPRMITPRLVLEVHGVVYVIAHCHLSNAEKTFRLDRIRECWLA